MDVDKPIEPRSDVVNESQDIMDITDNSPGPALVSETSLDVPPPPPPQAQQAEPSALYFERDSLEAAELQSNSNGAGQGEYIEHKENVQQGVEEGSKKSEITFEVEEEPVERMSADESSLIKLQDIANEILHQSFETAANISQNPKQSEVMEFTKNYSDDLLMGSVEQRVAGGNIESGGHDLADFELPSYNASSSGGIDQTDKKSSPTKQRKSSSLTATQASSSAASEMGPVPTDLSAVKSIIISTYSKISHLFLWQRPIESAIIFTIGLVLITALTFFSIISVVAYSTLGIMLTTSSIRIYKISMKALGRSSETPVDHLWEKALNVNISLSPERMHELVDSSHANLNASMDYFKKVLLVEDKVATLKSFLFLYSLTYIGACFNGLTLITIMYVSLFSVPVIYEKNKSKIDEYSKLATSQLSSAISMVSGKANALAFGSQSTGNSKKRN